MKSLGLNFMTWLPQTPSLTLPRWEREQNHSPRGEQNPHSMREETEPSPLGGGQGGGETVTHFGINLFI